MVLAATRVHQHQLSMVGFADGWPAYLPTARSFNCTQPFHVNFRHDLYQSGSFLFQK